MKNYDTDEAAFVHMYIAIRRRKENPDGQKELCLRQIIRDEAIDLKVIEERIKILPGVWRIHKTVNMRNVKKAVLQLQKDLLDDPQKGYRLESTFKSILMSPECKFDRNFLLDIDTQDAVILQKIWAFLEDKRIPWKYTTTPNGFHIVTTPFNSEAFLAEFKDVTLHRDGYLFVKRIVV